MSATSRGRLRKSDEPLSLDEDPVLSTETVDEVVLPDTPADVAVRSGRTSRPTHASQVDESPLRSALSILTTVGPPLTIITALMFYFGWARSNRQAQEMGLGGVSLFGYSTQDYVLLSISTLYIPLLAMAVLAMGWLALHRRVDYMLGSPSARPRLRVVGRVAMGIGVLAASTAVLLATLNPDQAPLLLPLVLAGGTATAAYGGWLARAADDSHDPLPPPPPWQRALHVMLIGTVITLALFWEVSKYADVVGRGYAHRVEQQVSQFPRATAFSASPLGVLAPGVREERINVGSDADTATFRYRTTGMRFLVRSGGRVFLLHDGWTLEEGTVIVLPDSEETRWQFSHSRG